jgi:tetratricopeptide (TPR) repeat protein
MYLIVLNFHKSNHFKTVMNSSILKVNLLILIVLIFLSCSGQNKKDASDFFLKANHSFVQKNYTEALRLYDEAISKNPDFSDAYLNKGLCLLKLNKPADAYEVLTQAINIDPTLVQANLVRAETALLLGKLIDAENDLKVIEKEYKDSSRYFLVRGNLHDAKDLSPLSLADYDRAIQLDKSNVEALVNRGARYYKQKEHSQAKKDFLAALDVRPSQIEALNNLALIAIYENKLDDAVTLFDRILNLNPANALALNNKGYAYLRQGKLEEAAKLIDRSLDIEPGNGYALRNMGIYYQKSGQPDKALIEFNKAIEIAEPVDDLYGLTGKVYFDMNDKTNACKIWKQGIILKDSIAVSEFKSKCQ